jgi:hypothetical protein
VGQDAVDIGEFQVACELLKLTFGLRLVNASTNLLSTTGRHEVGSRSG